MVSVSGRTFPVEVRYLEEEPETQEVNESIVQALLDIERRGSSQARDVLARLGHKSVYILTDGLDGFMERCLKPASLRAEPQSLPMTKKIEAWRQFFIEEYAPEITSLR